MSPALVYKLIQLERRAGLGPERGRRVGDVAGGAAGVELEGRYGPKWSETRRRRDLGIGRCAAAWLPSSGRGRGKR